MTNPEMREGKPQAEIQDPNNRLLGAINAVIEDCSARDWSEEQQEVLRQGELDLMM